MCVLICKPAGKEVPKEWLEHCNTCNDDGLGVVWREDGRLRLWKHPSSSRLPVLLNLMPRIKDCDAMIHFRRATSGHISRLNTHPYYVDPEKSIAVAHNGVLPIRKAKIPTVLAQVMKPDALLDPTFFGELAERHILDFENPWRTSKESDTRIFVEHVLANLDHDQAWWRQKEVVALLRRMLRGDRMALLTNDDGLVAISEGWHEDKGCHFSNQSYKPWSNTSGYGGKSAGARGGVHCPPQRSLPPATTPANRDYAKADKEIAGRSTGSVANNDVPPASVLPLPISGFEPVDDDDSLIAYFHYRANDHEATRIECLLCRDAKLGHPDERTACGIFASDLPFLPPEICNTCKKDLAQIAVDVEAYLQDLKTVQETREEAERHARQDSSTDDAITEPMPVDADTKEQYMDSLLDLATTGKLGAAGFSQERLMAICDEITKLGADPALLSLRQAVEKFPQLFESEEPAAV